MIQINELTLAVTGASIFYRQRVDIASSDDACQVTEVESFV
jgi:hypothetical protein